MKIPQNLINWETSTTYFVTRGQENLRNTLKNAVRGSQKVSYRAKQQWKRIDTQIWSAIASEWRSVITEHFSLWLLCLLPFCPKSSKIKKEIHGTFWPKLVLNFAGGNHFGSFLQKKSLFPGIWAEWKARKARASVSWARCSRVGVRLWYASNKSVWSVFVTKMSPRFLVIFLT